METNSTSSSAVQAQPWDGNVVVSPATAMALAAHLHSPETAQLRADLVNAALAAQNTTVARLVRLPMRDEKPVTA